MGLKNRLDQLISELGLSGRAFERECGLASGSYASLGDRTGADKLKKILIKYPQVSAMWLLTGKGQMMVNLDAPHIQELADNHIGNMMDIAAKLGIGQPEPEPSLPAEDNAQLWEMIGFLKNQIETQNRIIEELTKKVGNDAPRRVARAGE